MSSAVTAATQQSEKTTLLEFIKNNGNLHFATNTNVRMSHSPYPPNHDASSPLGPALARSIRLMGWTRCTPSHARGSIFPVLSSRVWLPYKPIHRRRIRVGSHGQNGRPRCSTWIGSLRTWRTAAGFVGCEPTGGSISGDTIPNLGVSLSQPHARTALRCQARLLPGTTHRPADHAHLSSVGG